MGKTFRKKDGIIERSLLSGVDKRPYYRFYGDSFNHDGDKNPPSHFKKTQQKKFRRSVTMLVASGGELIPKDYKMPYYT